MKTRKLLLDYLMITVGATMMAVGISVFFEPYSMVIGGVTGLAIVIQEFSGRFGYAIPVWLTNIAFNIPLLILGSKVRGFEFIAKTLYATVYLSAAIYFVGLLPPIETDLTLVAVFGGVLNGVGVGLVFRSMASTGGTDLIASVINKYFPHLSIQKILFAIDSAIIAIGLFTFGPLKAMYALIAVYILSRVVERILEGLNFAKAAFIISSNPEAISKELMRCIGRGVTGLQGRGMYTGGEKNVILCVVSTKEIITLKDIVYKIDAAAFVMVADVREVLGEGFKEVA